MPDGFDPHKELARIYVLRDLMQSCRQEMPTILEVIKDCLSDEDPSIRLQAANMMLDRGFGKPRQHVMINDASDVATKRVVILPDNGRRDRNAPMIESEAA
jgi:predicted subunit of tRNA(5-methylaminomethyl-2-thiouridylate) methyltransferase